MAHIFLDLQSLQTPQSQSHSFVLYLVAVNLRDTFKEMICITLFVIYTTVRIKIHSFWSIPKRLMRAIVSLAQESKKAYYMVLAQ